MRVSAETITQQTAQPEFHGLAAILDAPSASNLLRSIRSGMKTAAQNNFDTLLNKIPAGFRLVPVFYVPAAQRFGDAEFGAARKEFLMHLAENQTAELAALGICDAGISSMSRGLLPANAEGRVYDVDVDHIIERNGSGLYLTEEAADDLRAGAPIVPQVNHFGNFILLPRAVHDVKNRLNEIQGLHSLKPGQEKWGVMMAPETMTGVCPAKTGYVLSFKTNDLYTRIQQSRDAVGRLIDVFSAVQDMKGKIEISDMTRYGKIKTRQVKEEILPALATLSKSLKTVFRESAARTIYPEEYVAFRRFYDSAPTKTLRGLVALIGFSEAAVLKQAFALIDADIPREDKRHGYAGPQAPR
jgi:hypothetical protein